MEFSFCWVVLSMEVETHFELIRDDIQATIAVKVFGISKTLNKINLDHIQARWSSGRATAE